MRSTHRKKAAGWEPKFAASGCREPVFALLVFFTRATECGVRRDTMPDHFYTFHTTPEQLRRQGARGGRACGSYQRLVQFPDGALLRIPFAALLDGGGKRLIESYDVSTNVSF